MRILVVEDCQITASNLMNSLNTANYAVDWVEDAESAETALSTNDYNLILLDVVLPDGAGLDILTHIRAKDIMAPVIMLTANDDLSLKIKALDAGADDYLVKPVKMEELMARIRALRRRSCGRAMPFLKVKDVVLNPSTKTVSQNGQAILVGPKEYEILRILMENHGRILTKTQIEDSLYGWNMEVQSNTIEVHIHGLRKKLGKGFIKTRRYVGYVVEND